MILKKCTPSDSVLLAKLNKQLIEDEGSDNPMSVPELERRMNGFFDEGYCAYLFFEENRAVGYALVDPTRTPCYLRQFFIAREERGKRLGTTAFTLLLQELNRDTIDIDVLTENERGLAFWDSLGFRETWRHMRLNNIKP